MNPLSAKTALDSYFFEARCKILDLAGILDRIHRGPGGKDVEGDNRLQRIRQALEILMDQSPARAERVQQVFSLPYEANWEIPAPKS